MGPAPNAAQRKFAWVLRLSFLVKVAALFGALLVLKMLGVW